MESAVEVFVENIIKFVLCKKASTKGLLVKKHTENLLLYGEFSFPNTLQSWHEFIPQNLIKNHADNTLLQYICKDVKNLIEDSKKWNLKIKDAKEMKDRIHIFLERPICIYVGLAEAIRNIKLITNILQENMLKVNIDESCIETNSLTYLRVKYLCQAVKNLSSIVNKDDSEVMVTSKSSSMLNGRVVLCGTVLNAKSGAKETLLSADDFIRKRQDEMTLIAQHKYGVRLTTDCKWKEFIAHLGESAVVFELLQTKPSCAVKINFDCSSAGSSKGAAFVLYNCARLETIIRTYNEKSNDGIYPCLPQFEDTDFTLLTQEDEWCLIFNYIMALPSLLKTSASVTENACDFRPHHICNFLCSMVRIFSQYYRKTRILMEPRKHLLPVIYARIHMLKILNDTLKTCLRILNIKSVTQM